jgi:hypothetical protein
MAMIVEGGLGDVERVEISPVIHRHDVVEVPDFATKDHGDSPTVARMAGERDL